MPATPAANVFTYPRYVRAHYKDTGRPLYNTLYIAKANGPASELELNIAIGRLYVWVSAYYIGTCAENVTFDPIEVRPVQKPQTIAYIGPNWRRATGIGGAAGPRAMALNVAVS